MSRYFVNEAAKPQKKTFAENLCRIARLRELPLLYAAAGFTLATPISAPVCAYGLPGRKKGNQISLVAFVKPGGRSRTRIYDLHDVNVTL